MATLPAMATLPTLPLQIEIFTEYKTSITVVFSQYLLLLPSIGVIRNWIPATFIIIFVLIESFLNNLSLYLNEKFENIKKKKVEIDVDFMHEKLRCSSLSCQKMFITINLLLLIYSKIVYYLALVYIKEYLIR